MAVGRLAGAMLKHRRAIPMNGTGKFSGKDAVSLCSDHVAVRSVSASTKVMPRPQISPALDTPLSCNSGGSYAEEVPLPPAGRVDAGLAERTVSLVSFN